MNPRAAENNQAIKLAEFAKKINMGRNTFYRKLREKKILNDRNIPIDRLINDGMFNVRHHRFEDFGKMEFRDHYAVTVTPKGQIFISRALTN